MVQIKKENNLIQQRTFLKRERFDDKKKKLEELKPYPRKLMQGSPILPMSQTFQYKDTLFYGSEYGPSHL